MQTITTQAKNWDTSNVAPPSHIKVSAPAESNEDRSVRKLETALDGYRRTVMGFGGSSIPLVTEYNIILQCLLRDGSTVVLGPLPCSRECQQSEHQDLVAK